MSSSCSATCTWSVEQSEDSRLGISVLEALLSPPDSRRLHGRALSEYSTRQVASCRNYAAALCFQAASRSAALHLLNA